MNRKYDEFLAAKMVTDCATGMDVIPGLNPMLFEFQRDITNWALRRGRAAVFADCGLGKGPMQMEWAAKQPHECIISAPLAVAHQFVREAEKFGVDLAYAKDHAAITKRITVTNYERLQDFHVEQFGAVAIDESSILKNSSGVYCNWMIDAFKNTPFRLCSSATPAPNDVMELGTHAEFLGIMTRGEMLAMYFTHDGGDTSKWRIKGHAQADFWAWLASWAVVCRRPSDLGYSDKGFVLPELVMHQITVKVDNPTSGFLFAVEAQTLQERGQARRETIAERVMDCAAIVNASTEKFIIWTNLNAEADAVEKAIPGAVQVAGADSMEHKEKAMRDFQDGRIRVLVSKVSIFGFGLNLQFCRNVVFLGLSDSFEAYYQAIRRCWRFGQTKPVNCYIITAETEGAVVANIKRKERDAVAMAENMVVHMKNLNVAALSGASVRNKTGYAPDKQMQIPDWIRSAA